MTRRLGGGAAALCLALAGCTADASVEPLPPPPSTQARPSTTAPPDYTGVALPAVAAGRTTTTTIVMGPGAASFTGKVLTPDGAPAVGATVHVERAVGKAVAGVDVPVAEDGAWSVTNILGGSYRVRAWRAPDLGLAQPAYFFLGAADAVPVELKLERQYGTTPQPTLAPNPPTVGQLANLAIQVTSRSVDATGLIQGIPLAGATLELAGGAGWAVTSANPAVADGNGRAQWQLVCGAAGVQPIGLVVNGAERFQLALPGCKPAPTPTTAPPPSSSTTTLPGQATTTKPAATTTTTRPAATTTTAITTTTTTRPATTTTTHKKGP